MTSPIPNLRHTRRSPLLVASRTLRGAFIDLTSRKPATSAFGASSDIAGTTGACIMALYVYWRRGASKPSTTIRPAPTQMPASAKLNAGQ
jgi:hypothetical protein